jgi:hypothetical protein
MVPVMLGARDTTRAGRGLKAPTASPVGRLHIVKRAANP